MDIMNLIHDICLTKININDTSKWKFITKNKLERRLDKNKSIFLNLDIFNVANYTFSFLNALDRKIVNDNLKDIILYYDVSFSVELTDSNMNINVQYVPRFNRFDVWSEDIAYTIYHNTKISNRINKMWEPLTIKIKEKYLEIIMQIAKHLASG